MISSPCPECGESVSVPEAAFDLDAQGHAPQAQCPWCGETTPLGQWNRQPMARLFDRDGHPLELPRSQATDGNLASEDTAMQGGPLDSVSNLGNASLGAMAGAGGGLLGAGLASVGLGTSADDPNHHTDADLASEAEGLEEIGDADLSGWSPEGMEAPPETELAEVDINGGDEIPSFGESVESFDAGSIELDGIGQNSRDGFEMSDAIGDIPDRPKPMRVKPTPSRPQAKKSNKKTVIGALLGPILAIPLALGALAAIGRAPNLGFWPFDGKSTTTKTRSAAAPVRSGNAALPTGPQVDEPFNKPVDEPPLNDSSLNNLSPLADQTPLNPELSAMKSELSGTEKSPSTNYLDSSTKVRQEYDLSPVITESSVTESPAIMPAETEDWQMPAPETSSKPEVAEETPMLGSNETAVEKEPTDIAALPGFEINPLDEDTPKIEPPKPTAVEPMEQPSITEVEIIPDTVSPIEPARREAAIADSGARGEDSTVKNGVPMNPKTAPIEVVETAEVADLANTVERMVRASGNQSLSERDRNVRVQKTYYKLCELAGLSPQATPAMKGLFGEIRESTVVDLFEKIVPRYFNKEKPNHLFLIGELNPSRSAIEVQGGKTFSLRAPAPETLSGKVIAFGRVPDPNAGSLEFDLSVAETMAKP